MCLVLSEFRVNLSDQGSAYVGGDGGHTMHDSNQSRGGKAESQQLDLEATQLALSNLHAHVHDLSRELSQLRADREFSEKARLEDLKEKNQEIQRLTAEVHQANLAMQEQEQRANDSEKALLDAEDEFSAVIQENHDFSEHCNELLRRIEALQKERDELLQQVSETQTVAAEDGQALRLEIARLNRERQEFTPTLRVELEMELRHLRDQLALEQRASSEFRWKYEQELARNQLLAKETDTIPQLILKYHAERRELKRRFQDKDAYISQLVSTVIAQRTIWQGLLDTLSVESVDIADGPALLRRAVKIVRENVEYLTVSLQKWTLVAAQCFEGIKEFPPCNDCASSRTQRV